MARKLLTGADFSNQKAVNLADGSSPTDAVTKQQLDAAVRGLDWKASVKAASTATLTLSGAQTVDGVALVAGDRVLIKDQTSGSANGIYVVSASAWSRAADASDSTSVTPGLATTVEQGTVNADKTFVLTNDSVILGTTALTFSLLGGATTSYTAGNGLALSAGAFSVVPKSGGGIVVDGTGVSLDSSFSGLAKRYAATIGDGSATTITVTHGLGTRDVTVSIYDSVTFEEVVADVFRPSVNTVSVGFASAPGSGAYRVVVTG